MNSQSINKYFNFIYDTESFKDNPTNLFKKFWGILFIIIYNY